MARRTRFLLPVVFAFLLSVGPMVAFATEKGPAPAPANSDEPVQDADRPAAPLTPIRPNYPTKMVQSGVAGSALLRFVVGSDGVPRDFEVMETTHEDFAREAMRAVRATKFRPAERAGKAVATRVSLPVKFVLEEDVPAQHPAAERKRK